MGWTYEYLNDELRDEITRHLKAAGINEEIEEIKSPIDSWDCGEPECGVFEGEIVLHNGEKGRVVFVVYKRPTLFTPGTYYEEYGVGVHEIWLDSGKVVKGDVLSAIEKEFREEANRMKKLVERAGKKLKKHIVKTVVNKKQRKSRKMVL